MDKTYCNKANKLSIRIENDITIYFKLNSNKPEYKVEYSEMGFGLRVHRCADDSVTINGNMQFDAVGNIRFKGVIGNNTAYKEYLFEKCGTFKSAWKHTDKENHMNS